MMLFIDVCGTFDTQFAHPTTTVCRDLPGGTFFKLAKIYKNSLQAVFSFALRELKTRSQLEGSACGVE
jgi:hypothetical protein